MKRIILVICVLCLLNQYSIGQDVQDKTTQSKADEYWKTRPAFIGTGPRKVSRAENATEKDLNEWRQSRINQAIYREMYRRTLRDWGIEFWKQFPNDPRKFLWLQLTCISEPAYWANLRKGAEASVKNSFITELDTIARNDWHLLYADLRKEVLTSMDVDSIRKKQFLMEELPSMLFRQLWRNSSNEKFDVNKFVNLASNLVKYGFGEDSVVKKLFVVFRDKKNFGLTDHDVENYVMLLKTTGFPEFQKLAVSLESMIKLEKTPLSLKEKSISGEQIDLKNYRGKLVLVDFWSLGCRFCIEKMPEIKSVYDKYKNAGFEVVSVCMFYNDKYQKNEINAIKSVHHKIGADWPLVLLGGNKGEKGQLLFETYGWYGVPQLLLLDENGKLVSYGGELTPYGNLEKLVKEHLGLKSTEKKSGK